MKDDSVNQTPLFLFTTNLRVMVKIVCFFKKGKNKGCLSAC